MYTAIITLFLQGQIITTNSPSIYKEKNKCMDKALSVAKEAQGMGAHIIYAGCEKLPNPKSTEV